MNIEMYTKLHAVKQFIDDNMYLAIIMFFLKYFKVVSFFKNALNTCITFLFSSKEDKYLFFVKLIKIYKSPKYMGNIVTEYDKTSYKEAIWLLSSKDIRSIANIDNYHSVNCHYLPHLNPTRKGYLKDRIIIDNLLKYKCVEYEMSGGGVWCPTVELIQLTQNGRLIVSAFADHIKKYGEYEIVDDKIFVNLNA